MASVPLPSVRTLLAAIVMLASVPTGAAAACRDLALLRLPATVITTAAEISGKFAAPPRGPQQTEPTLLELPAICRVAGTITPAIRFEVWLPLEDRYNGRLQSVGGGGLAGNFDYAAMNAAVTAGFASAATDTGHRDNDSLWLADPQRREDYGSRAIHEMTLTAKTLIDAFYGSGPEFSYFNGCSTGGRQGLMEAQRYPNDYDGIISGAPVNAFTQLHMGQLWTAHATLIPEGAALDADDLELVNAAVLAACDANDGVADGILADPRSCSFDPSELACRGRSTDACLATPKVDALAKIYAGAVNPRTGAQIYPGLEPGGENAQPNNPGWALIMDGEQPFQIDIADIGGMGFENPRWDWRTFNFVGDVALIEA
jgi:feruloyl esterase